MEVTEGREGWKEEESANRQGGSELDMSVATVSKSSSESSGERSGVEERRGGTRVESGCGIHRVEIANKQIKRWERSL